jgi:SAM-dependent methyltransferase
MDKAEKILEIVKPGLTYTRQNNALCFLPGNRLPINTAGGSLIGLLQDRLKRFGGVYYFLVHVFSPVIATPDFKRQLKGVLKSNGADAVILNLGSGPQVLKGRRDIINVDLYAFDAVDLVANADDLPLEDETVDLILNLAMLEHTKRPDRVVEEMQRVLKPGGVALSYLPFMVPFHAAPHDYHRWTLSGAKEQFDIFGHAQIGVGAGPVSGILWVFQEWVAVMLSFGNRWAHDALFLFVMILTAPLKLLDLFLVRHPCADRIASGFCVMARK